MAERETIVLEWTMVNWITIIVMVIFGFAIIGTARAIVVANLPDAKAA